MGRIEFKEFYYDLQSVWEDVYPDEQFHIAEHSPQPAIAQLVNEYNEHHRLNPIALIQDGMSWSIDDDDCPRILEWYKEFISARPASGGA